MNTRPRQAKFLSSFVVPDAALIVQGLESLFATAFKRLSEDEKKRIARLRLRLNDKIKRYANTGDTKL